MAGLFKGLFGGKGKKEEASQKEPKPAPQRQQAYYLNTDEAQTFGNVDYMRSAKKVRRTFPKTVNNEEMELEKEVSSMNRTNRMGTQIPKLSIGSTVASTPDNSATTPSVNSSVPTDAEVSERRKADTSLDMFRNMAKEIRK